METVNSNAANEMNFLETLTIEEFKKRMSVDSVHIKTNPKTGKLFMVYGTKIGKVSTKGKGVNGTILNPVVSKMSEINLITNENVWMLHEKASETPDFQTL